MRIVTSLWVSILDLAVAETFFLVVDTTQSTEAAASAENPIPGPHQTSWKSTQVAEPSTWQPLPPPPPLLLLCFFFLVFFRCQSAEARITAGTDTCCDAPAVHPNPLNVAAAEKLLFFLPLMVAVVVVSLEKGERSREEMVVDLQHLVDWTMGRISGSGSVSEIGWWLNWFLGLLHLTVLDVTKGMVDWWWFWLERDRERECVRLELRNENRGMGLGILKGIYFDWLFIVISLKLMNQWIILICGVPFASGVVRWALPCLAGYV